MAGGAIDMVLGDCRWISASFEPFVCSDHGPHGKVFVSNGMRQLLLVRLIYSPEHQRQEVSVFDIGCGGASVSVCVWLWTWRKCHLLTIKRVKSVKTFG